MYRLTIERAAEIGVPVVDVPGWYDVDDEADTAIARGRAGGRTSSLRRAGPGRARRRRQRGGFSSSGKRRSQRDCHGSGRTQPPSAPPGPRRAGPSHAGVRRRWPVDRASPRAMRCSFRRCWPRACSPSLPRHWRRAVPARAGLILVLGLAIAMRLAIVGADPLLSTDIYRYVWDGRVQGAGINPYLFVPADPALAGLRDTAIYPHINRADYAVTAYPPVAQMFFFGVTRIAETLTAMRLAMVGVRGGHRRGDHRPAAAAAAARGRRGRLGVASAGDLGDRQQRPCRGADGGAADAGRVAARARPRAASARSRWRWPSW